MLMSLTEYILFPNRKLLLPCQQKYKCKQGWINIYIILQVKIVFSKKFSK